MIYDLFSISRFVVRDKKNTKGELAIYCECQPCSGSQAGILWNSGSRVLLCNLPQRRCAILFHGRAKRMTLQWRAIRSAHEWNVDGHYVSCFRYIFTINLPLKSSCTTNCELLSQFSTCGGWLEVPAKLIKLLYILLKERGDRHYSLKSIPALKE